jgi:hypothetical protein
MAVRKKVNPGQQSMCLSEEDRRYLDQLQARLQLVRDRVSGVVGGYATGLYLYGEGGAGKSYTVTEELKRRMLVFASSTAA